MNLKNMKRGETTEQISLFKWAERNAHVLPCLSLMYHVPNEGKRTNGAVLKAMGLKTGVPDVVLPVASHNFHGLYLEMKYGKNTPTKDQKEFMAALRQQGYKTAVCYSADEAVAAILEYLQEPGKMPLNKCLAAPWIDGQCDGVPYMGRMFSQSLCQECKNHTATRAEAVIKSAMAAVPGEYRRPIVKAIMELLAGHPLPGTTLEDTLETINKNLAWLVKGQALTVEQSAAVLTVAMDAYKRAKGE